MAPPALAKILRGRPFDSADLCGGRFLFKRDRPVRGGVGKTAPPAMGVLADIAQEEPRRAFPGELRDVRELVRDQARPRGRAGRDLPRRMARHEDVTSDGHGLRREEGRKSSREEAGMQEHAFRVERPCPEGAGTPEGENRRDAR